MSQNIILSQDSYKYSMYKQFPRGTEYVYSYIESRGGEWKDVYWFGLQAFIKEYLAKPITMADIDEAESVMTVHGEPFNREGWEYILDKYQGYLPVSIKAANEGALIPTKNVLLTIENTDPKCFWLTNFLETSILRGVWYTSTVATNSYESMKIIKGFLEKTGTPENITFALNDFGSRGVSSSESSALGGMAHLATGFMGTDNVLALLAARKYYSEDMAGYSIPATEHTISSSYGRDNERDYINMMLDTYGNGGKPMAIVADTYDVYNFCKILGTDPVIKQKIIENSKLGGLFVVRPDSGYPAEVVVKCLYILAKYFGTTKNAKGFSVLNNIRMIQGDGIDHESLQSILFSMEMARFSADNIVFGQGGALLQSVNRDTMKWAMKCSAIGVREDTSAKYDYKGAYDELVWHEVFKDPITDSGKRSKKGRVTLWKCGSEYESSVDQPTRWVDDGIVWEEALTEVFRNGKLLKEVTFAQVRAEK